MKKTKQSEENHSAQSTGDSYQKNRNKITGEEVIKVFRRDSDNHPFEARDQEIGSYTAQTDTRCLIGIDIPIPIDCVVSRDSNTPLRELAFLHYRPHLSQAGILIGAPALIELGKADK